MVTMREPMQRDIVVLDTTQQITRRATAVVALAGISLVHLLDLNGKIHEVPYIGWMFVGLIISALVIADGLIRADDGRIWLAAGGLALATIGGYVISRTTGLPGDHGADKGNWLESLGLASLVLEGIVVLVSIERLNARSRRGHISFD